VRQPGAADPARTVTAEPCEHDRAVQLH
jgi:hypothetical protein